jgi:aminopeptidase N
MNTRNTRTLRLLTFSMMLTTPAWAMTCPPRYPFEMTENGRVNFPPELHVDFEHLRLELLINDMNTPEVEAVEYLTFTPIGEDLSELGLDAHLLEIESVEAQGYSTSFTYDGAAMCVSFDPPVPVGQSITLATTYRVTDPPFGLNWTVESDAFPGRPAQIHSQGEAQTNSYWFPCHDFPNDRLTTELIVTSPQGYEVLSNGRLVGKDRRVVASTTESGEHDLQWYDVWHWSQDEQAGGGHVPYLVSLVVGKFDVVDVGTDELPMPVYVPQGRGGDVEVTYGRTGEMVELFDHFFDEPYPWSKYAQAVLWNFGAGGMENTSATSMFDAALYSEAQAIDQDFDGLIAHELGHQWFGDLMTCDSWEHIWLNEGFATYLAGMWFEHRDGHEGYLANMQGNFDRVNRADTGTAPGTPAMVSPVYDDPWDVFRRGANPYPKGASILHMLRQRFGDEAFYGSIRNYIDEHRLTTVVTSDLQDAFEQWTGESLGWFFDQWAMRPGIPRVKIETSWDEAAGALVVTAEQTQTIDADNPAFVFDLPIWVHLPEGGEVAEAVLSMDSPVASASIALPARPDMVVFNAELDVLAELDIDQPTVLWLEQLASGPTLASKIQAARVLANDQGTAAARLLYATALDPDLHDSLRKEAVKTLEAQGDLSRVFFLVPLGKMEQVNSPSVRVEALEALGRMGYDHPQGSKGKSRRQITATLVDHAMNDPSTNAKAAAVRALGTMKAVDAAHIVREAVEVDSPRDAIRRAAIEAMADFNTPEALEIAIEYSWAGAHNRTRPTAIAKARKLMDHYPEAVKEMLAEVLFDRERRAWEAAAKQIADIGGPWAEELLTRKAESLRDPRDVEKVTKLRDEAGE